MFVPTETSVEKIINLDSELFYKAFQNNIFIVGPSGLMNILALTKFQVSELDRQKNYELILNEVTKIVSSINILIEHCSKVSGNIQNLVLNYDKLIASLNKSFITRVNNLEKLGVTISKPANNQMLTRYQLISSKDIIEEITGSND